MRRKRPIGSSGFARLVLLCVLPATLTTIVSARPEREVPNRFLIKRIEALLAKEFHPTQPGGVVLIARRDKVLFRRAYGLADLELGVPMRSDAVFRIGSITKQFTAVAILKLVEEGKLNLTDDVQTYVPEFPHSVTIEQVLTHTSGLPNLVDLNDFEDLARRDYRVDELLALTKDEKPHFTPGNGFKYSDTGYILLGAVIERASGLRYGDYLESKLFRPLGMESSYYGDDRRVIPHRIRGYSFAGDRVVNASYISMSVPHAAGGLVSTVDDLLRWDIGLRNGAVVRRGLLDRAWSTRTLPDGTHSGYGFGWKMCEFEGRRTIEHGGWINGFSAKAIRLPEDDLTVIVLVNNDSDRPDAGLIARRLAKLILTGSDQFDEYQLTVGQRQLLVGQYVLTRNVSLTISEHEGSLYYQRGSGRRERLIALSPTKLSFAKGDRTFLVNFERDKLRMTLSCEPAGVATRVVAGSK